MKQNTTAEVDHELRRGSDSLLLRHAFVWASVGLIGLNLLIQHYPPQVGRSFGALAITIGSVSSLGMIALRARRSLRDILFAASLFVLIGVSIILQSIEESASGRVTGALTMFVALAGITISRLRYRSSAPWFVLVCLGLLAFDASTISDPALRNLELLAAPILLTVILLLLRSREADQNALQHVSELEQLASRDPLTQLYNRRGGYALIEKGLAEAIEAGRPVSLTLVDLDGFKQINDIHSHSAGDLLLQNVADVVARFSRRGGEVAMRLGGDEFVLFASRDRNVREPAWRAGLKESLGKLELKLDSGVILRVSASVGVYSEVATSETRLDTLLREADRLMYADKRQNKAEPGSNPALTPT